MARHTPPPPVDVEELFPELIPYRRETVRLHPRTGTPSCRESSVGGPLLWPAEEPWPVCEEDGQPLVPVAQLFRADLPDTAGVAYPEGCDLLQVLWCALLHKDTHWPESPHVRWRDSAAVGAVLPTPVPPAGALSGNVPQPCAVHPETVAEYAAWNLPQELFDRLDARFLALEEATGVSYEYHLAEAPGIKAGGWPGWCQDPRWPDCRGCRRPMAHLMTVAAWEFDAESWRTWLPREDRGEDGPDRSAQNATGLGLGGGGGVYLFECPACPGRPVAHCYDR
ncbi:DUF1963 domain-containing protein [Streptomyces sp. NPDC002054]|uniref:DUF1963 domain-containing protein n=1 Tax=Streptomyces sp. NPDC002054 TaxID=3154663 RepID=UPI003325DE47